ncbi:hypothetical protein KPATCC21470_0159 [Kitasatospora purpeofusca]
MRGRGPRPHVGVPARGGSGIRRALSWVGERPKEAPNGARRAFTAGAAERLMSRHRLGGIR